MLEWLKTQALEPPEIIGCCKEIQPLGLQYAAVYVNTERVSNLQRKGLD
jgi:hypothetical protein